VTRELSGAPGLRLHGRARRIAAEHGLTHWEVSLSHEREYASALVLAYSAG
jgi:phosphopantetheinyl transferase (holo-ACP synthase)